MQLSYSMVFVSDMQTSIRFYRDIIGLALKFESPEWTEFNTGITTLALHAAAISECGISDEYSKFAGQCQPGFSTANLATFHSQMIDNGVFCIEPPRDLHGISIAQYKDPDGLVFSVSETRNGI